MILSWLTQHHSKNTIEEYPHINIKKSSLGNHQYKKHLQEMIEVGAIHKSTSPWASPVILVCKKNGDLWFCIDLRKLNNRTIKDAQSLPRIEDSLDCLDGLSIFTSLDLQLRYWQVELTQDSRPLSAFTMRPFGFYECI